MDFDKNCMFMRILLVFVFIMLVISIVYEMDPRGSKRFGKMCRHTFKMPFDYVSRKYY
jgi:amino acid permease